jgi:hypothetical protein
MGGQTIPPFAPGATRFFDDLWAGMDGIHWEQVDCKTPVQPHRGMIGGSAVFRDRIWILGGGTYDTPEVPDRQFYNDVWSSPDGVNWTEVPDTPWAPRHAASVFVYEDALWMVAGNNMTSDVWRLERVQG